MGRSEDNDVHLVVDKLYIGSLYAAKREGLLKSRGITHILSVTDRLKEPLYPPTMFTCKLVHLEDEVHTDILSVLHECISFIQSAMRSIADNNGSGGILVHCVGGKSRSATVILAFLIREYKMTLNEALVHLKMARPICEPNHGFMRQLKLFAKQQQQQQQQWQ